MLDDLTQGERAYLQDTIARILDDQLVPPEAAARVKQTLAAELELHTPRPSTLLYTGWRGASRERVVEDLQRVLEPRGRLHVVVGFDPKKRIPTGGDMWTYEWATTTPGVTMETHPAPWHLPELRRSAGGYRNGFIAGLVFARGGDLGVLAHLHKDSRGATGMAAFATYLGMRVWRRPAV